ncbi:protein of unknown function [Cupriavidus taiwanensis]|uniref:Uncharacterized protein n=1 Tax=Cupriavidus taiwanensis TaxID=164546 RepID=A0A375FSP7_9BURK|nr:protein of unknown function [Cupriavidus taiwanensis]SPC08149.1 hypothetical protein CT19431_190114 [Cupriavidus taiwanensis]SPC08748.1 hypothetical protein CBM2594_A40071 [Cupriavidus taiwanensis]
MSVYGKRPIMRQFVAVVPWHKNVLVCTHCAVRTPSSRVCIRCRVVGDARLGYRIPDGRW